MFGYYVSNICLCAGCKYITCRLPHNKPYKPINSTISNWYKAMRGKSNHASLTAD